MIANKVNINISEEISKNILHFLGVRVDNISKDTAVKAVCHFMFNRSEEGPRKIYFTNVHTISLARKNNSFKHVVNSADLVLPDGSGLKLAGIILSNRIKENLNGTDFTPIILRLAEINNWKVYMLGAKPNIITQCVQQIQTRFPSLKIAGYRSGYFKNDEVSDVINDINDSGADILLVGMGSPIQETLINDLSGKLNVTACFGVGGLFDFLSGDKKRAPLFVRKVGLEWLFRFFNDPGSKWNRIFIEIPVFIMLVFKAKIVTNP